MSRNNQITDPSLLSEINTLIEIDLESNPVDNYLNLINSMLNKKDILVYNLKLTPIMLNI